MENPRVALVTLGCARNEVDSEELAGRLLRAGFDLAEDAGSADAVVVNTCGFIEAAKRESIETLLSAAGPDPGSARPLVAVGCLAQRYGSELAAELPEATVLGFEDYPDIGARLHDVLAGVPIPSRAPTDRRALLPLAPVERPPIARPGAAGPGWIRHRLDRGPAAALKIASGCDRRCAFCAIPMFRGSFISRPASEILDEARWLLDRGVRELVLVSENSTSYGKDRANPAALEHLLVELAALPVDRIRVSYLQPAEVRAPLVTTMIDTPRIADYFDLSFQHASAPLLRRMRRFGGTEPFLALLDSIRERSPRAGVRTNVIVGFPGESTADVDELCAFLSDARFDAVGVFGYSAEDGTEAAGLGGQLEASEVAARVDEVTTVADEVMAARAEDRVGETVEVLVESCDGLVAEGRAEHQGPDDGATTVHVEPALRARVRPGSILRGRIVSNDGVDLHAVEVSVVRL